MTTSPVNPPRQYWVACDTGVKLMLVDRVQFGDGVQYAVRGKVYSAVSKSWSGSSRWRYPVDANAHHGEKSAREAWKAWKTARRALVMGRDY